MTEQERAEARHKRHRLVATLDLLREFTERPSVRQIVRYPFIHTLVLATMFSATTLFVGYVGQDHGIATGVRLLVGGALLSGLTILLGLQWRNPVVGRGIESFGQLLMAAVWIGNNVIIYFQPPGQVDTGWSLAMVVPSLFCLASLVRTLNLYLTTEKEKAALGIPPHLHRSEAAGYGTG